MSDYNNPQKPLFIRDIDFAKVLYFFQNATLFYHNFFFYIFLIITSHKLQNKHSRISWFQSIANRFLLH